MKKRSKIILIFTLTILILIILLTILRTPAGYDSESTCPSFVKDCSCFGLKMKNLLDEKIGGETISYCYGIFLSNCKCYEVGCPKDKSYKKEIQCSN